MKRNIIYWFDFVGYVLPVHYGSVKYNKDSAHGCF